MKTVFDRLSENKGISGLEKLDSYILERFKEIYGYSEITIFHAHLMCEKLTLNGEKINITNFSKFFD